MAKKILSLPGNAQIVLLPPQGFCPEGEIPRGALVACTYIKQSIQSVCQQKSWFAAWNRWVIKKIPLFEPASRRWLGWWKQEIQKGQVIIGRFCDIYCTVILQYSFALHAISNILWSSCYVSYGPKDTGEVIR